MNWVENVVASDDTRQPKLQTGSYMNEQRYAKLKSACALFELKLTCSKQTEFELNALAAEGFEMSLFAL